MMIVGYKRMSEDVRLLSGNPFTVRGLREENVFGGFREVYTGLCFSPLDDCTLRIQPAYCDAYVVSWRFTKEANELVLFVRSGAPMDGTIFTVWVVKESVIPMRFAEEGKIMGGPDA